MLHLSAILLHRLLSYVVSTCSNVDLEVYFVSFLVNINMRILDSHRPTPIRVVVYLSKGDLIYMSW